MPQDVWAPVRVLMSGRARLLLGLLVTDLVLILFCCFQQAELRRLRSLRAHLEGEIEVAALARMAMPRPIRIETAVERHHPGMPRYVLVPASEVARWKLEGTIIVEGTLNGMPLGRRSLKRWGEERWFVELRGDWCRKAGIATGDRAELVLELASTELPDELVRVLSESTAARRCWDRMTVSQRRVVREHVLAAKESATRERRARKALVTG